MLPNIMLAHNIEDIEYNMILFIPFILILNYPSITKIKCAGVLPIESLDLFK
jgi:hypothetical protein